MRLPAATAGTICPGIRASKSVCTCISCHAQDLVKVAFRTDHQAAT